LFIFIVKSDCSGENLCLAGSKSINDTKQFYCKLNASRELRKIYLHAKDVN